jgi:hypothetical protein
MNSLIEQLKRFNRKEPFFLVGLALDNPNFTLGANFPSSLGNLFKFTIPSERVFVTMDYPSNGSTRHFAMSRWISHTRTRVS